MAIKNSMFKPTKKRLPKVLPLPANLVARRNTRYRSAEANEVIIPGLKSHIQDLRIEIQRGIDMFQKAEEERDLIEKKFKGLVNVCKKERIDVPNRIVKKSTQKNKRYFNLIYKATQSRAEFRKAVKESYEQKVWQMRSSITPMSILSYSFILPSLLKDYGMDEPTLQLLIVLRAHKWFVMADAEAWGLKKSSLKRCMDKLILYGLVDHHENANRKTYHCTEKGKTLVYNISRKINRIANALFDEREFNSDSKYLIKIRPKSKLWNARVSTLQQLNSENT